MSKADKASTVQGEVRLQELVSVLRARHKLNPLLYDTDKAAADALEYLIRELQKERCVCIIDGEPLNQCDECPR